MWFLLNQIGVCITSLRPGPVTMDYKVWSKPRQVHNAAIVVWGVLCTRCAKVASNYVKISSSPLNPLSKVINCLRENMSPKEPNELWWLCKLFLKGKVVGKPSFPFSSVSRGGVEVFKAWDWMLHYARAAGSRFNPDQTENLSNASIRLMSGRSFLFLSISFHPPFEFFETGTFKPSDSLQESSLQLRNSF